MPLLNCRALILRAVAASERDRYISLITREKGIFEAYVRSATGARSMLAATTEPFSFCEFTLFENKGRYTVNKADFIYPFRALKQSLEALTAASHLAELSMDLMQGGDIPPGPVFELLLRACYAFERSCADTDEGQNDELKDLLSCLYAAEFRLLRLCGYGPTFTTEIFPVYYDFSRMCFIGEAEARQTRNEWQAENLYAPEAGPQRRGRGEQADRYVGAVLKQVPEPVYNALRHFAESPLEKLFNFRLSHEALRDLSDFMEEFRRAVLDKTYRRIDDLLRLNDIAAGLRKRQPETEDKT